MHKQSAQNLFASAGFSLVEVMLAILVIGVAGLGAAALSLSALRESSESNSRAVAVELASDLMERIKSNPTQLASVYIPGASSAVTETTGGFDGACFAAGCTPAARAQHDLREWAMQVRKRLPNSAAVLCRTASPSLGQPGAPLCDASPTSNNPLVLKFWWDERGVLDNNAGGTAVVQAVPQSVPLYYVAVNL